MKTTSEAVAFTDRVLQTMLFTRLKITGALVMALAVIGTSVGVASYQSPPAVQAQAQGEQPRPIPAEQFDKLHKLIKPQQGELRFQEIPWLLNVTEARKKAAAEGKPIFVWSG